MIFLIVMSAVLLFVLAKWLKPRGEIRFGKKWYQMTGFFIASAALAAVFAWKVIWPFVRWFVRRAKGGHGWAYNPTVRFVLATAVILLVAGWFYHYVSTPRKRGDGT